MKIRKALFLFVFLSSTILVCGQSIDIDSEWRVNSSTWDPPYQINYSYYRDFIDGDTVINSKQYYKVYQSGYGYIDWIPHPFYHYFEHLFHGYLREENNKWYTLYNGPQEELLYDFNLQVNDTIESAYTYTYTLEPITITVIDSILVDSAYRKRFHLSVPYGAEYIIEGIGATSGLFENMMFFEWESELICFAKNGISIWGESTEECDLNVGITDNMKIDRDFHIYPNPARNYIKILAPQLNTIAHLTLVNTMGTIVLKKKLTLGIENIIYLNKLASGVYIIIIENELITRTRKLIVE